MLGFQRMERGVFFRRPPAQPALRESSGEEPKPTAVITQHFDRGALSVAKDEQGAGEGVFFKRFFAKCGQPINPIAEVDGLAGKPDSELREKLNHSDFKRAGTRRRFG